MEPDQETVPNTTDSSELTSDFSIADTKIPPAITATPSDANNRISSSSSSHPHSTTSTISSSSSSLSNVDALSIAPNPSFANNFWSPDYISGVHVIFDKLKQGCAESTEVLTMIQDRVNLENNYAISLQSFQDTHKPTKNGFDKDEGASLRLAYLSYINDITIQGMSHSHIARDIDRTVRGPLQSFNQAHKTRVDDNYSLLIAKINHYHKLAGQVQKLQTVYYAKCRQREDLDSSSFPPDRIGGSTTVSSLGSEISRGLTILKRSVGGGSVDNSTPVPPVPSLPTITIDNSNERIIDNSNPNVYSSPTIIELLPGFSYNLQQLHKFILNLLDEVPLRNHRIAMLGVYNNVTPGDEIVRFVRKRLNLTVGQAEKFGQSLVRFGFIRPIAQVLGKFVNSPEYFYQWLPKALEAPIESVPKLTRVPTNPITTTAAINTTNDSATETVKAPSIKRQSTSSSSSSLESKSSSPSMRIQKEIKDAEDQYKIHVIELDLIRCDLEKSLVDVLGYMEQCEKERLITIKQALKEMSRKIARPQDIDIMSKRLYLHQESINPDSDLRYLVENYKTSIFRPNVVIYKNFSDNTIYQTFGVDVVNAPFIIPIFVDYLQEFCENEESVNLWTLQSPISDIYQLRNQINTGKSFEAEQVFTLFPIRIVISTFKQLLLEMPDSIISFTIYDTIKSIYSTEEKSKYRESKIESISGALGHMPKPVIAQLTLLIKHLVSICDKSGNDRSIEKLAFHVAPYIFRPRASTSFNMKDKHPGLLIKDLLHHSEEIFTAIQSRQSVKTRQRSYSEANRRAVVEARNKELAALSTSRVRSRPGSPLRTDNGSSGSSSSSTATGNSPIMNSTKISSSGLLPLALSPSRQPDGGVSAPSSSYLTAPASRHRKSHSNPTRSGLQLPAVISPSPRSIINKDLPSAPSLIEVQSNVVATSVDVAEVAVPSSVDERETEEVNDILDSYDERQADNQNFRTPELQTISGED